MSSHDPVGRESSTTSCRVCRTGTASPFQAVGERAYWRCLVCRATFVDAAQLPDAETEQRHYLLHENDPGDIAYRRFLSKLAEPLVERLPPAQEGLDYGCGPGPALSLMLAERGHDVRCYDPFFHPDRSALDRTYAFITCTETAEHFHHPADEFTRLDGMLRPGGTLAIMTRFMTDDEGFATWHYRRDPTHVVFYQEKTFHHLARHFGWSCTIPAKDVVLLLKPRGDTKKVDAL